ncbi:MAG: exodeoxyribonuclease VII large subunit [Desulfuromusa sp.]|jgi:exodeoxyribonuclease VII large subunit|nr:exodeoxyribonuclease VII large subunit [Desulfuromusa sp.]
MDISAAVSVSTLVQLLQELVEDNFVEVLVRGELSNVSQPASGHYYFTLKDKSAQLRCAMFRSHARTLRFKPTDGLAVICRGRVSVYPQRGDLQLIVEGIEPEGVGGLQLAFDQLKEKLENEGLFAQELKQPLPPFPQTIGIVTSASGAAIQDILNVLRRRSAGVGVLLRSVRVQGEGAAEEIAAAIVDLNIEANSDVLIVGRGGGAREDLWAFNEEIVARAIAVSRIPVISAVGHEVDFSISDLVADLRAPTPSAAAELVVQNRLDLERHLDQLTLRLAAQMRSRLSLLYSHLYGLQKRLKAPQELVQMQRLMLQQQLLCLRQAMNEIIDQQQHKLDLLISRLETLSPLAVLSRGYAIVKRMKTGQVVHDVEQLEAGDHLQIKFAIGQVAVTVVEIDGKGTK